MVQFKTITLRILEDQTGQPKPTLEELDRYARLLKSSHDEWTSLLREENPGWGNGQIESQALELAIMDLQDCLASASPPGESEDQPLSLDAAMDFIRKTTRPA
jgi:hypothetical protein